MTQILNFEQLWREALSFEKFVAAATKHQALWAGVYRTAEIPTWAVEAVPEETVLNFLVIAEDWCGDASNAVPVVAKWVDQFDGLRLKIIRRDEYPAVMDQYLTDSSRSIPIIIALDADFQEVGHWGPRPEELQRFVMHHRAIIPKQELYPQVRRWYARDRGVAILREVMQASRLRMPSTA